MPANYIGTKERSFLGQIATRAFKHLDDLDLIDHDSLAGKTATGRQRAWRHGEYKKAAGLVDLKKLPRRKFRDVKAHFLQLLGQDDKAFQTVMKTGQIKDSNPETHEEREQVIALIEREIADYNKRGGEITIHYFRFKTRDRDLIAMSVQELNQLLYTVRNRIAAQEGRGTTKTRNKSQS